MSGATSDEVFAHMTEVNLEVAKLPVEPTIDLLEKADQPEGRFQRAAGFLIQTTQMAHERLQYAAVAMRADPYHYTKRTVQTTIVGAELSLFNEAARYGSLAFALANTEGGPLVGAVALGATTFMVEAPAAVAAADLADSDTGNRAIRKVNDFIERKFKKNFKMNPILEAGVAMTGGSAVVTVEKKRENPAISKTENRRHGLFTAGWMSAYFSLEGAFIGWNSRGGDVINGQTVGSTILALGLTATGSALALRNQLKSKAEQASVTGSAA